MKLPSVHLKLVFVGGNSDKVRFLTIRSNLELHMSPDFVSAAHDDEANSSNNRVFAKGDEFLSYETTFLPKLVPLAKNDVWH